MNSEPYDVYARLKVLRARLLKEGFVRLDNELKETVDYGYTGTEIHMGVRKLLTDFLSGKPGIEPETRNLINEIVTHIENVLDGATG